MKPGVDPARGRQAARRDHGRLSRQWPDRGRGAPRRDAGRRRPHPRARAGRRLRRQGRRAGRGPGLCRRQRLLQEDARRLCGGDARPRSATAMQQWLGRPAFTVRLEPGDRPPYDEAKGAEEGQGADIATQEDSRAPIPADRRDSAARLPRRPACHAVERREGRLCAAHHGPGDAARAVVRRRLFRRRAGRPRACRT